MKRYVKAYANDKINSIKSNGLMQEAYKTQKIKAIEKAVSLLGHGLITVDETMKLIIEA